MSLGILTLAAGIMGFVKKGSLASLYAGFVFGFLLLTSGILMMAKKKHTGNVMASLSSATLSIAMAYRLVVTGKIMPSGMVAIIATFSFVYHTIQIMKSKIVTSAAGKEMTSLRWWQGLLISSIFTAVYLLTPMYLFSAITMIAFQYPSKNISLIYSIPFFVSMILPSTPMPFLAKYMTPMLDYFDYEEITETSNGDALKMAKSGRNFMIVMQPHGVVSFLYKNYHALVIPSFDQDSYILRQLSVILFNHETDVIFRFHFVACVVGLTLILKFVQLKLLLHPFYLRFQF